MFSPTIFAISGNLQDTGRPPGEADVFGVPAGVAWLVAQRFGNSRNVAQRYAESHSSTWKRCRMRCTTGASTMPLANTMTSPE